MVAARPDLYDALAASHTDRFQVMFAQPSYISQPQGRPVSAELPADDLRAFIEATRGRAGRSTMDVPPPRTRQLGD